MVNRSRAKGTAFETAVVRHLRDLLPRTSVERLPLLGNADQGDLVVVDPARLRHYVLEAKATQRIDLAGAVAQAAAEAANYAAARNLDDGDVFGAAVIKRRNHSVNRSYVVMELDTFARLVS